MQRDAAGKVTDYLLRPDQQGIEVQKISKGA